LKAVPRNFPEKCIGSDTMIDVDCLMILQAGESRQPCCLLGLQQLREFIQPWHHCQCR